MTAPAGPYGLARGLTIFGDADFALYLRRSFVPGSSARFQPDLIRRR